MIRNQVERNYLRATAQNASPSGLVIILFDLLVNDLCGAIAALQSGDIEKRSAEIKHALLILQQLEGSLDMKNGGDTAKNFARFYSFLRSKILEAHIKMNGEILTQQVELALSVRNAWQQVDTPKADADNAQPEFSEPGQNDLDDRRARSVGTSG